MKIVKHFPLFVMPQALLWVGTWGFVHHVNMMIPQFYTKEPLNLREICECVSTCKVVPNCSAATYSVSRYGILCWLPLEWIKYSYLQPVIGMNTFFLGRTFKLVGNQFYYMVTANASWYEANETCSDLGGGLATFETEPKEKQVLRFIVKSRVGNFYIGMFNFNLAASSYIAVVQTPSWILINGSQVSYTRPFEPWNYNLLNKCFNYYYNSTKGIWSIQNTVGCQGGLSYLCVKD